MTSSFNDTAINTVFDKIVSYAMSTGRFDSVNQHEPKSAPSSGISCSVWIQSIRPIRTSGLASTSGCVLFSLRIYTNFKSEPADMIDPKITAATTDIMGALSADFEFGGAAGVRNLDLLGSQGTPLSAAAGYIELDRRIFRVMTIQIPVLINDMFTQVA